MRRAIRDFYLDIINHFEMGKLRWFTRALVVSLLIITLLFIIFFVSVVSTKLDEDTKYFINASSEFYEYKPVGASASEVLIQNFRISESCGEFEGEIENEKLILKFEKGSTARILRFSTSFIRLDILSEEMSMGFNTDSALENIAASLEGVKFKDCLSIEIQLSESNPVFTITTIGDIEVGREISDAPDQYNPVFLSGEIIVEGKSAIQKTRFNYEPIIVSRGAKITFEKDENAGAPRGILRASRGSEGIDSTIIVAGAKVYTQLYRETKKKLEMSFLNRLYSDNEAAIGFSALLILIQFLSAIIAFLMRLKFINNTTV